MPRFLWAVLLVLSAASSAQAQMYYRPFWGWGGNYASTPAQGYAYGMAEVTRAQGQYNLQTAQAAQAAQQAYSQQLDNKLKATQTYFEMRKMNREYTQAEEAARRKAAGYGSPAIAPKYPTLTSSQLDPVTGEIGWTSALSDPYYSQYRKQFEDFFRARADHSLGNRSAAMEQLQIASNEMMAHLNQNIDSVRPQEWVDAKRLIEALMREARMPSS